MEQENEDIPLPVVLSWLEDGRRLIQYYKSQRWDVMKWALASNLALTVAATRSKGGLWFFLVSLLFGAGASALVCHYKKRLEGARSAARISERELLKNIDTRRLGQTYTDENIKGRDCTENTIILAVIWFSVSAPLVAWLARSPQP